MRFYTTQHPYYCGIDLHARSLYVCILDDTGETIPSARWFAPVLSLKLTGFKPDALNSASNRLNDECLVPLLSVRKLKSAGAH